MKFRLVDKILSWTPNERIRGVKAVSFEEYSLKEPFADPPRLPEMLMLESFLQLGNWLILLSSDYRQMGMVVKLAEVRFHDFVRPGEQLQLEVHFQRRRKEGFLLTGEGRVRDQPVITGLECLAVGVPAEEYVDPSEMRTLFEEIYQPDHA